MKKILALIAVIVMAVSLSVVSFSAATYNSPEATTAPEDLRDPLDLNKNDNGGNPVTGDSSKSPATGDYVVFAIAAAAVFGSVSLFAAKKIAR